MSSTTAPEVMAGLQARISARLASTNTFREVRSIIQEFLGGDMDSKKEKVSGEMIMMMMMMMRRRRRITMVGVMMMMMMMMMMSEQ